MDREELEEWIRFARDDLEAARILLGHQPRKTEIICYHCAQSAEKYLKALAVLDGKPAIRTHDLRALAESVRVEHPGISSLARSFADLQPYAVAVRYPLELQVRPGDEEAAAMAAGKIAGIIESILHGFL